MNEKAEECAAKGKEARAQYKELQRKVDHVAAKVSRGISRIIRQPNG